MDVSRPAPELTRRDESTMRMALASPSSRRLRTISIQILAVIGIAVALLAGASLGAPFDLIMLVAAMFAAAWAGYWTGLGRGLDALFNSGAAYRHAGAPEDPDGRVTSDDL